MIVLNAIVAHQLIEFKKTVDRKVLRGKKKDAAILEVLRDYIRESKAIRFEGNGYSKEWEEEAAARGLSNVKQTPRALDAYVSKQSVELFTTLGIFKHHELHARHEIRVEQYIKKTAIEARIQAEMITSYVIPASISYQSLVLGNINAMKAAGLEQHAYEAQLHIVRNIADEMGKVHQNVARLKELLLMAEEAHPLREQAIFYGDRIVPLMAEIRLGADALEELVADDHWPLPKYREMLFAK
jgi:glutamine synthetase